MKEKRLIWILLIVSQITFSQTKGIVKDSLTGKPILLNEVEIIKKKHTIQNEIGKFDKNKVSFFYALAPDQKYLARKFSYNDTIKNTPFLKSLTINTRSHNGKSSIKIRFMLPDVEGNPSTDLLDEDVIIKLKRGNRNSEIDISKYNLKISETGIFLVVEFLQIKENSWFTNIDKNNKTTIVYSPSIGALPSEEKNLWIFNKKWRKIENRNPYDYEDQRDYFNKYIELAISLKLTN